MMRAHIFMHGLVTRLSRYLIVSTLCLVFAEYLREKR